MHLLTAHVDGVAVETGTPREEHPAEATGTARVDDGLVAGVGVAAADPDPTGAAVAAARTVRERAAHLSVDGVLVVPAPSLVAAPAGAERTAETLDAVVEWVRVTPATDETSAPDLERVERAPVGYHLAVEGSVRGHPHAVRRHRVPPDPPVTGPSTPGGPAPTWDRVGPDAAAGSPSGEAPDSTERPAAPRGPERHPRAAATGRLGASPGLYRDGDWLPGGVAARRAVELTAVDCLGAVGGDDGVDSGGRPLAVQRDARGGSTAGTATGGPPPWRSRSTPAGERWLERSPPADARPTLHVRTDDPTTTLAGACDALATVATRLAVAPGVAVRGGDASAVAAAVDGPVSAGPAPPGDRRVDVSVVDGATGLPVGRAWSRPDPTTVHAAVGPPASALAAARAAAVAADRPLPAWLAPTTLRLIPVAEHHHADCLDLVDAVRERGIRADCDDRAATVAARLDRVDAERLPFHAVVGDRELDGVAAPTEATLPLVGPDGRQRSVSVASAVEAVTDALAGASTADPGMVPRRVSRVARRESDGAP